MGLLWGIELQPSSLFLCWSENHIESQAIHVLRSCLPFFTPSSPSPGLIHNSESLPEIMRIVYVVALTIGLFSPAYAVPRPISVPIENPVGSLQARGPSEPLQPKDVELYISFTGASTKKPSEDESKLAKDTVQGYLDTIYDKRQVSFRESTFYFFQDNKGTVRFKVMDPVGQLIKSLGIRCGTPCSGVARKKPLIASQPALGHSYEGKLVEGVEGWPTLP
ncbi:hypothetical protein F5051DRAFT_240270 [Lentinula edodes]|nr:hypothetical protein F5051DRAFT_240270 [Lentinula edodes]